MSYNYDANSNRISLAINDNQIDDYFYDLDSHKITHITGTNPQTFRFDDAGYMTQRNTDTHIFNDRGRLSQLIKNTEVTTYHYNAFGERVIKATPEQTTHYGYLKSQLLFEATHDTIKEYIWLNGRPLALKQHTIQSPNVQLNLKVNAGKNDAKERANGTINRAAKNLRLVKRKGRSGLTGIRFNKVVIPQGVTINQAYLQFTARKNNKANSQLTIQAEAIGHSPVIKKKKLNLSQRTKTTSSVDWTVPA